MPVNPPVITALAAAILIALQTVLMLMTAGQRRASRASLGGEAGAPALQRAVRRHGNLAENAAIFLVGLALAEMLSAGRIQIEVLAAVFVLSRLSHAIGLSFENTVNPWRIGGVVGTAFAGFALAVRLAVLAAGRL
jgi:uncharacterized membrane protein YecN with MAPEG domain